MALAKIGTEYLLFGGAGLISLIAFVAPDPGARRWAPTAAPGRRPPPRFLSLFVLAALVLVGVAAGVAIVYYWNDISELFG